MTSRVAFRVLPICLTTRSTPSADLKQRFGGKSADHISADASCRQSAGPARLRAREMLTFERTVESSGLLYLSKASMVFAPQRRKRLNFSMRRIE